MAHDGIDELGFWVGTQEDFGHDVPESTEVFPGSLTAEDQERQMAGSLPAGPTARVKDQEDDFHGLRSAPAKDTGSDSDVPVTADGDKVTKDGKRATSDDDAAPIAGPATSEAVADDAGKAETRTVKSRKAATDK